MPTLRVSEDPAGLAAEIIAEHIRARVSDRLAMEQSAFHLALSGGRTPWAMLERLARQALPWDRVEAWQVDERVAPDGHEARNWTQLAPRLPPGVRTHPIPIDVAGDPTGERAARAYASALPHRPFDLVHLGLGDDGHTASLFPGARELRVRDRAVIATAEEHLGWRRITLTYARLSRASVLLFLVTGASKRDRLKQLLAGDSSIPAGRLARPHTVIVADPAAAGG